MNMYPQLTSLRSLLIDKFYALQTPAWRASILARVTGQNATLSLFPEQVLQKNPNRKFIGVEEIPVEKIVGTLNRQSDFDHKFRPLKGYLRDRWVNAYLAHENGGWAPILVHKIGDQYYVEDGHHRVSIARSLGMGFIHAKIWDYPVEKKQTRQLPLLRCPERSCAEAYASRYQQPAAGSKSLTLCNLATEVQVLDAHWRHFGAEKANLNEKALNPRSSKGFLPSTASE